jgi:hypothetical protein
MPKRFEYKQVLWQARMTRETACVRMNNEGANGWEVIHIGPSAHDQESGELVNLLWFKRELD